MRVGFISLGCTKNLIDTEIVIGLFKNKKFEIVQEIEKSEIIVINTCGFIESAKEEAINTIMEAIAYKEQGICRYLVVIGCLVQRYCDELREEIPEVDLFITIDEYNSFWNKIEGLINKKECKENDEASRFDYANRVITTGNKTAYLKIAEGCSNRCTYCAIPYIRGKYISRPMEDILQEAKKLALGGYSEIIIIAQDTTKYGIDIYGETKLAKLLEEICKIEGFKWVRFLYSYPESITDELIQVVKSNRKICNYFDIPIQHISNKILKTMNRRGTHEDIETLINKIRKEIPDSVIRTSLIVGFPGETEEDFEELYEFIKHIKLDRTRGIYVF